jgi:hypothetical protein
MLTRSRCEALAATPSAIDDTVASQLVRIHQGRLRFDHERLARFLAAEHLVLSATDGIALAQLLNQLAHRDLHDYALLLAPVLLGASLDIGNSDEAIAVPAGYPTLPELLERYHSSAVTLAAIWSAILHAESAGLALHVLTSIMTLFLSASARPQPQPGALAFC